MSNLILKRLNRCLKNPFDTEDCQALFILLQKNWSHKHACDFAELQELKLTIQAFRKNFIQARKNQRFHDRQSAKLQEYINHDYHSLRNARKLYFKRLQVFIQSLGLEGN